MGMTVQGMNAAMLVGGAVLGAGVSVGVAALADRPGSGKDDRGRDRIAPLAITPLVGNGLLVGSGLFALGKVLLTPVDGAAAGVYGLRSLGLTARFGAGMLAGSAVVAGAYGIAKLLD